MKDSEVGKLMAKMTPEELDKYEDDLDALEKLEEEVEDLRALLATLSNE